jgi:hypothetical protein
MPSDEAVREIIRELEGRGYRDPVGRDVTVHLATKYLGASEGEQPDRCFPDVAPSLDDLVDRGRLDA